MARRSTNGIQNGRPLLATPLAPALLPKRITKDPAHPRNSCPFARGGVDCSIYGHAQGWAQRKGRVLRSTNKEIGMILNCILSFFVLIPVSESVCKIPTCDVVFLVDGTSAVGAVNFQKMKDCLRSFIRKFVIALAGSHVGLVQFTPMARPEFYFKHNYEQQRVEQSIASMAYEPCQTEINCYGSDDLNSSLPYAAELALSQAAGNRPEIPDVVIVVTTGHQNSKSNTSLLNAFRPLSPRLIYVLEIGDVPQFTRLPGADVIQIFHVSSFDHLDETEEPLCNSVRGGVLGIVTGDVDGFTTAAGNNNNNRNNSAVNGKNGNGANTGSADNGNNGNDGNGNGKVQNSDNGGTENNGGSTNGLNGVTGDKSNSKDGKTNGINGNSSITGTGSHDASGGKATNGSDSSGGGNGEHNGQMNGANSNGSAGNGDEQRANSNSAVVASGNNEQQWNSDSGSGTAGTTTQSVVIVAAGVGPTVGILILLIVLAILGLLILLCCLYKNRQENKSLVYKIQELRTAAEAPKPAVSHDTKAVQVLRGSTPVATASLADVTVREAKNGTTHRTYDQHQLTEDGDRNLGNGSGDGTFTARRTDPPPPIGTYWLPQTVPADDQRNGRKEASVTSAIPDHTQRLEPALRQQIPSGGRVPDTSQTGIDGAKQTSNGHKHNRFNNRFKRPANVVTELPVGKSAPTSLNAKFSAKRYSDSTNSTSVESSSSNGSHYYSEPATINGTFARKGSRIPVKKLPLPFLDLLFLVDNSGSIGNANFDRVKEFLKSIASDITVSSRGSRIGCVMFNQVPSLMFGFDKYMSTAYVMAAIDRLTYMGGGTFSGKALRFAAEVFKTASKKHRQNEQRTPREEADRTTIVVFISDGVTEDHVEEASEDLRSAGVHVAAVSVKEHHQEALLLVTRNPRNIFKLNEHQRLVEWIDDCRRGVQVVTEPPSSEASDQRP